MHGHEQQRNRTLVSAIVPVYNVSLYLDKCVHSIVNQSYEKLEIILVDDGSTDESGKLCDVWAARDARIKVIHKQNGGLSDARNAGIDIAQGEYLAFVDSDDWIEPNMIECMVNALEKEDADYCVCGIANYYEQTGLETCQIRDVFVGDSEAALKRLYNQTILPVASWCKLVRSTTWGDLRFPVGRLFEDAYTTYQVIHKSKRIVQIPDALYHYRIRENSIMTSPFSLKHMDVDDAWKANYLFCKEHYPRVADDARAFWLEHLPPLIAEFPSSLTDEERKAKTLLQGEIRDNLGFVLTKMGPKKAFHLLWALRS